MGRQNENCWRWPLWAVVGLIGALALHTDAANVDVHELPLPAARAIDQGEQRPEDGSAGVGLIQSHWAFRPPKRPPVPSLANFGTHIANPIDAFVAAKLAENKLTPSVEADRVTLIRRLYFVMLGMPPTPEDVAAFVADKRAQAFERLVDRVLDDPRYGERWGRHWLDVIRFAESNGFETNRERPNGWRFRDYVIAAFNGDKPYDQFIREQIAGDALGVDVATGFLVAGPVDIVKSPDVTLTAQQRADEIDDMIGTTGTAFLGLTLGCARCHSHKFDPISHREYYSMAAVFAGVQHGERALPLPPERKEALAKPLMIHAGTFSQPGPTHRLHRGDPMQKLETVPPGTLAVFKPLTLATNTPEQERRLKVADWIASPENPLTARVLVNRLWQHHFGVGLVTTPNDFGKNGGRPSHPELLDWLASEFVAQGWSIKRLHRQILTSATWRQASAPRAEAMSVDAGSRLLWRFSPRRLEAEGIRDSILAVSGNLDRACGGPSFFLHDVDRENVYHYHPKENFGPAESRRMVYAFKVRMEQDGIFGAFDCPDGSLVMPRRSVSTTPLQALNLFNSRFMLQQAAIFAARLQKEAGDDSLAQVRRAWELAFNRFPDRTEAEEALAFVRTAGLPQLCRAVLNANEFLFIP